MLLYPGHMSLPPSQALTQSFRRQRLERVFVSLGGQIRSASPQCFRPIICRRDNLVDLIRIDEKLGEVAAKSKQKIILQQRRLQGHSIVRSLVRCHGSLRTARWRAPLTSLARSLARSLNHCRHVSL